MVRQGSRYPRPCRGLRLGSGASAGSSELLQGRDRVNREASLANGVGKGIWLQPGPSNRSAIFVSKFPNFSNGMAVSLWCSPPWQETETLERFGCSRRWINMMTCRCPVCSPRLMPDGMMREARKLGTTALRALRDRLVERQRVHRPASQPKLQGRVCLCVPMALGRLASVQLWSSS